eukprot:CAMPEP_0202490818 /NCGR_PEP_ID=MMETSP1361-20130828/8107_1 /ASSEMBLY_ACC=CAM_ASM_000849 /TAXON_ID=210615 /ORGANISM="Staurosira complex sp., Strain CCMP2646" /LENGTH=83 /DNA_ID=CAMNT_0049120781 /DNA_START=521 /DNA_END=769 /DNA_ORIENTATION=+
MAAMRHPKTGLVKAPWQREKYIDAKKVTSFAKKHCESILELFDEKDITVKSNFGDDDNATVTTVGTNENNESDGNELSSLLIW